MSKTKYLQVFLFVAIILAGCTRSSSTCNLDDYDHFDITLDDPANGSVVSSLTPTLNWSHSESCRPERFLISVQMKEKNGVWTYLVDGDTTDYRLSTSLQAGGEYYWTVSPYHASTEYRGKISPERIFYTGSSCEDSSLLAPVPVGRFAFHDRHGEWISPADAYKFEWYYPGDCLPESYYYEFAEDWSFTSIIRSGVTTRNRQYVELELPDCSAGYWRVAAGTESDHGPFSEKRRYFWATDDSCWMLHVPSDGMTQIHGRVYQDYCDNTFFLSSSGPLSDGCISTEGIGVHADGLERAWEAGVESAVVELRPGACPSPSPGEMSASIFPDPPRESTVTDWYGVYEFVVLSPGNYCLSISKVQSDASVDLTDGLWTEPLTESAIAYKTITIPDGTPKIFENIGWDEYDHLTMYMEAITHCREGDSKSYPAAAFLEMMHVPLLARNQDASWLKTRINGVECYFANLPDADRESDPDQPSEEDILDLPVFKALPPPKPTATTKPPKPSEKDVCAGYANPNTCTAAGCTWDYVNAICKK